MNRKSISWKTHYAAALLALRQVPYEDAKRMTEDQMISLYHLDHNILHSTEDPNRDLFWNLTPMLIGAHREKTKKDAKIIAKSRRVRKKLDKKSEEIMYFLGGNGLYYISSKADGLQKVPYQSNSAGAGKLRSRGFDKTKTRGFDGKVRERRK